MPLSLFLSLLPGKIPTLVKPYPPPLPALHAEGRSWLETNTETGELAQVNFMTSNFKGAHGAAQ